MNFADELKAVNNPFGAWKSKENGDDDSSINISEESDLEREIQETKFKL